MCLKKFDEFCCFRNKGGGWSFREYPPTGARFPIDSRLGSFFFFMIVLIMMMIIIIVIIICLVVRARFFLTSSSSSCSADCFSSYSFIWSLNDSIKKIKKRASAVEYISTGVCTNNTGGQSSNNAATYTPIKKNARGRTQWKSGGRVISMSNLTVQ